MTVTASSRTAMPRRCSVRARIGVVLVNVTLTLCALVWLLPVYWMVNSSLQTDRNLLASPPKLVPAPLTFDHFHSVLVSPVFHRALGMSLLTALITVVTTTTLSLLAALALTRFQFRGKRTFIVAVLVVQMIPAEALFISQYRMLDSRSSMSAECCPLLPG